MYWTSTDEPNPIVRASKTKQTITSRPVPETSLVFAAGFFWYLGLGVAAALSVGNGNSPSSAVSLAVLVGACIVAALVSLKAAFDFSRPDRRHGARPRLIPPHRPVNRGLARTDKAAS